MKTDTLNRTIIKLAWPAILEMTLHTMVWVVDTAMVGRLGKESIAAVNLGAQIMFGLTFIAGAAVSIGVTSLVARFTGAKAPEKAEFATRQGLLLSFVLSIGVSVGMIMMAGRIMGAITSDMEVAGLASRYLRIVFIGGAFQFPYFVANGALRGAGNTKIPLLSAVFADVFNIAGDYVLIFGKFGFPKLGVQGAAIATALSLFFGFAISFGFLMKGKAGFRIDMKEFFVFDKKEMRRLVEIGFPSLLENLMNEGSRMLSSFWIVQLGTLSYAAHSITVAAESISFMPGYGFSIAATTLVGQYLGAGKEETADRSARRSVCFAVGFMSFVGMVFLLAPGAIMGFFSTDAEVVRIAKTCVMIAAFEQPLIAVSMVFSGALRGAGDTRGPFYVSLASNLLIRLPLIYVVVFVLRASIYYIWGVMVLQFFVEALLMWMRYNKGDWKRIELK